MLASFTVFGSELPTEPTISNLYVIDFSSLNLAVSPGERLALVLRASVSDSDSFLWAGDSAGGYPGGSAFSRASTWQLVPGSFDAGFRTFILPEPCGAAGAALVTLLGLRRRQRVA